MMDSDSGKGVRAQKPGADLFNRWVRPRTGVFPHPGFPQPARERSSREVTSPKPVSFGISSSGNLRQGETGRDSLDLHGSGYGQNRSAAARTLIYTCNIGGYDRVLPVLFKEPNVDYVLITDNTSEVSLGWTTCNPEPTLDLSRSAINRYYKILGPSLFDEYACSIYIDANIGIDRPISPLVDDFLRSDCMVGLLRHPFRSTIAEEMEACCAFGKAKRSDIAREVASYTDAGFRDDIGLTENNVIIRRHDPRTVAIMKSWWDYYLMGSGRDQISLPFIRWLHGSDAFHIYDWSARERGSPFRICIHHYSTVRTARSRLKWEVQHVMLRKLGLLLRGHGIL